jgi:hypothetical protein
VAFAISAEAGTTVDSLEFALHLGQSPGAKYFLQPTINSWTLCTPLQLRQICSFLWQADGLLVVLVSKYTLQNRAASLTPSGKLKIFSNAFLQAPDTSQVLVVVGSLLKSPPSKIRGQIAEAFQTFPYDADYATRHGHSTSSTPNCQCG